METTLLESCRVSPPSGTVAETFLPLTFFDLLWLNFYPLCRVLFFDFPYSKTEFTQNIVPILKTSLSLALKYFSPLAGNLITPSSISDSNPLIRYLDGDSVSLTFVESTRLDYNHLSGNHARDVDELFRLVSKLPPSTTDDESSTTSPVLAVQVTLFPNHGYSVGFTNSHAVADGSSMFSFIRAWSSISKDLCHSTDANKASTLLQGLISFPLPIFDRDVVQEPKELNAIFRTQIGELKKMMQQNKVKDEKSSAQSQNASLAPSLDSKRVQATFVISQTEIKRLKNIVSTQYAALPHLSSFTVVSAYVWTCFLKARIAVGMEVYDDTEERFAAAMDCRGARLNPPIPETYFGNCLSGFRAAANRSQLVSREGFVIAAKLMGEAIYARLHGEGPLEGVDKWITAMLQKRGRPPFAVAGSPKLEYYNIDFGWDKPKKFEFVGEKFSLSKCKDSQGMEIGLCFPKNEMQAFSTEFTQGFEVKSIIHLS